jgi:hypothetical protein
MASNQIARNINGRGAAHTPPFAPLGAGASSKGAPAAKRVDGVQPGAGKVRNGRANPERLGNQPQGGLDK